MDQGQKLAPVYIHIDMDAYYAQAEAKYLGVGEEVPLCARQWNSLLAVNYPARERGIKRGMNANEAKKLCPEVLLPHVKTFKVVQGRIEFCEDKFGEHNQFEEKVSLQYYREESKAIFKIISRFCSVIEKGGTDEAYIRLKESEVPTEEPIIPAGKLMAAVPADHVYTETDCLILQASHLVQQIRNAIFKEAKYKCSAGISFNKMLAKLASSVNKPNQQTVILECMLPDCLKSLSVGKLRGFGGKVEEAFHNIGVKTLGEAQAMPLEALNEIFAERGQYIHQKIRGFDDEEVKVEIDQRNKTINSLKNIRKTSDRVKVGQALELITYDISMRIIDYYEDSGQVPTVVTLVYNNTEQGQHQKSESLDLQLPIDTFKLAIEAKVEDLFKSLSDYELFPLVHIGVSCKHFKPVVKISQNKITKYFSTPSKSKSKEMDQKLVEEAEQVLFPDRFFKCHLCGNNILKDDQRSHDDYHAALELDRQLNPNKRKYKKNTPTGPGNSKSFFVKVKEQSHQLG